MTTHALAQTLLLAKLAEDMERIATRGTYDDVAPLRQMLEELDRGLNGARWPRAQG